MTERLRVLVAVTGAFYGRLRVRRSTGTLDTEGLDRILSEPSVRAIALAKKLQADGAEIVAVHVDKGLGELVLREAMAHGLDQGILVEGAEAATSSAGTRAATIADVYEKHGPFDAVIGPAHSSLTGFSGALAAVAGALNLPCIIGVKNIYADGDGFGVKYESIFGDYELTVPKPCVILAGQVKPSYPTAWDIRDAYHKKGVLKVKVSDYSVIAAVTKRRSIELVTPDSQTLEEVDGATLVRRLRSRSLIGEKAEELVEVLGSEP
jgi:electron transfer flavoprotein alpha/beta subunit